MKTYKFIISTGFLNCDYEEEMEFEDDVTDEELTNTLRDFLYENIDVRYEQVK